jgi:hypothetical protein
MLTFCTVYKGRYFIHGDNGGYSFEFILFAGITFLFSVIEMRAYNRSQVFYQSNKVAVGMCQKSCKTNS